MTIIKVKKMRKKYATSTKKIYEALKAIIPDYTTNKDIIFVCIGTDRYTGDSLGPLVGTELKKRGYKNVYGTLDKPIHAANLEESLQALPKNKIMICIDSALGRERSIGKFVIKKGQLHPGKGVGKELPSCGDYCICGVIDKSSDVNFINYLTICNTRLSLVMKMADRLANAITMRFPIKNKIHIWRNEMITYYTEIPNNDLEIAGALNK
jgi:putative sporulation protein YyaC